MVRLPAAAIQLNYGNLLRPLTTAVSHGDSLAVPLHRTDSTATVPRTPHTTRRDLRVRVPSARPR